MPNALDPERRTALLGAKLRALALSQGVDAPGAEPSSFAGGAALRTETATWVLLEPAGPEPGGGSAPGLGAVLAWAVVDPDRAASPLQIVADGDAAARAGALAHQASLFSPAPTVWRVRGRQLDPVIPEPPAPPPEPAPAALGLIDTLEAAGLEVVVEHGVVRGEIAGLEVAVVIVDDDGTARVEVGVGRNDREAFALLHGDLPTPAALRQVADAVHRHRHPGAPSHPLNHMAAERWLRAHLLRDEAALPGWSLDPVAGPVARVGVADRGPAFAYGHDDLGAPVVVATSVGIDLELVPSAAVARDAVDPAARLALVLPARDAHPVTRRLAARLAAPADIVALEGDWRR